MPERTTDTGGFHPDAVAGRVFDTWPKANGLLRPGLRHDRVSDTAWVCLTKSQQFEPSRVWMGECEGLSVLAHLDEDDKILDFAVLNATLHLPPSAIVHGAMAALPMRFNPAEDALQVMFHPDDLLDDITCLRWLRPSGEAGAYLMIEGAGLLSALVISPAHLLVHPTLISDLTDK